ncbi:regulatory protein RecX [Gordonia sp. Z-3]|uniref:Regulatory protein RecX n=2 Tax=Gordonia TaxID=2053 RepID=A0A9X3D5G5_9ACTN|nr:MULTISPECIES: regulatory protein RecX [Gordonia]MCF3937582.1 recombination regulator RecX [Gordonia tangerina]MCX2965439.1 regulatory protein RecX [Gordonia aquimaris]MED5800188.1 regulatory protein RecX [Gordonia sp. Z-3]
MSTTSDPEERTGPSAWDAALRLLGVRARSRHEMIDRLARKGFDSDTVDEVMARLDKHHLIDDEDFAAEWVRSRHAHSARGRVALRQELRAKGIDAGIVESALADLDPEDERVAATDLIAKKLTPSQVDRLQEDPASRDAVFRRLVGMLMRRGYAQSLAIEVVTESLDAVTTSTD